MKAGLSNTEILASEEMRGQPAGQDKKEGIAGQGFLLGYGGPAVTVCPEQANESPDVHCLNITCAVQAQVS